MENLRYRIKGYHPESDSEWFVTNDQEQPLSFDSIDDASDRILRLPEIDHGLGHYEIWDTVENKSIDGSISRINT